MANRIRRSSGLSKVTTAQSNPIISETSNTFKELAEKGLIKPGMTVLFDTENIPINIAYEQSGKKAEFDGLLLRGIVVEEENNELAIVTRTVNKLSFRGRFAYAYYDKTINYVVDTISKKVFDGKLICTPLTPEEVYYYFSNSKYFSYYLLKMGNYYLKDKKTWHSLSGSDYIYFDRENGVILSSLPIGIKIKPSNQVFSLCKSEICDWDYLFTYYNSPFEFHLEYKT